MSDQKPAVAPRPEALDVMEVGTHVLYASEVNQQGDLAAVIVKVTGVYVNLTVFTPTGSTHGVTLIRHDAKGAPGTWRFKSERQA